MIEAVGIAALGWLTPKVVDALFDSAVDSASAKVRARLNRDEVQRAIAHSIHTAHQAETRLPEAERLFFRCDDKAQRMVLEAAFSHGEVLAELKRPFANEGKPRLAVLTAAFERVMQDTNTKVEPAALNRWLAAWVDAYFERTSAIYFDIATADYCTQVADWYDDVKFAGIAVDGQVVDEAKKIEKIVVIPDAVQESRPRLDPARHPLQIIYGDQEAAAIADDWNRQSAREEQRQRVQETASQWSGPKVSAAALLSQPDSKKLVLLGAPGAGKTLLMSYFAVVVAKACVRAVEQRPSATESATETDSADAVEPQWGLPSKTLPILIRIRDLAAKPEMGILSYLQQVATQDMACETLPGEFFETFLRDGRALILLDGLDEVADEGKRQDIVRKIENFLGQYKQNRAIVTSRPAGYRRDFFHLSEYPHYQLQPFDDEQIRTFIDHWYDSRVFDPAEADRRKTSLQKALNEQDRIKQLARNPLLLTIIALIHRYQAQLPRERHKLCDKAVETLLTTWDANREITSRHVLQYLRLDDLRRIMERLAYWIHTQGGTGDSEGGTLIDKDELLTQLSHYIREMKKVERHEAKAEAERFLHHIRERTGLLNEQGPDRYAFVHKTFQEYLAAQEIHDQKEDDFNVVLNHIRHHLHDPHWREVLLLLIAQQKRSNPTRCLTEILNFPDPYDAWLHRNLFFAAACLAEDIPVGDEGLVTDILNRLVALETSTEPYVSRTIKATVFKKLCSLYETEFELPALQQLHRIPTGTIAAVRLQTYRAALGEEEDATATLLKLLQDPESHIRSTAADALGTLSHASDEVVEALLRLLQNPDSNVRSSAVGALGKLGRASEAIVAGLLSLLQDPDWIVRFRAAVALDKLGCVSDAVVAGLLSLLQDPDSDVRSRAAEALGKLGCVSDAVVAGLLSLLQDPDSDVRFRAAEALGRLGRASDTVEAALLSLMQDPEPHVRYSAAAALGKLGRASDTVEAALLNLLQDPDSNVRSRAAAVLSQLDRVSDAVEAALLNLLQDPESNVRYSAAVALGLLDRASDAVEAALLNLLQDPESNVRYSAAAGLGLFGKRNEVTRIAPLLVTWLEQNPEADEAGNVVDALWAIVVGDE
ncbi:MAG: HEAT repeat domain-containing protein [Kaiparowitsia implicata GSE-PSE-MK54-09C]|jgi:HEAT repeat protein|nr:HEAT repeat domain-containing protein [Kaiparowitsia implicata GSE-PSE-MK54-09C]